MDETLSLWTLFGGSFLASTLLPGGSEVALFGALKAYPQLFWPALAVATLGRGEPLRDPWRDAVPDPWPGRVSQKIQGIQ